MELDLGALDRRAAYRALISMIIPRPIAFVSTLGPAGNVNVAPFSYFNGVSSAPPIVSISVGPKRGGTKDTAANIRREGEFVVNVVTPELMAGVIVGATDPPPEVSELELAKLTPAPSSKVRTPGVKESPIRMECALHQVVDVEGGTSLILGRVVHVHVDDAVWVEGRVDPRRLTFVGRLGDDFYCRVNDIFEAARGTATGG
ncbi:MAG TPA: flavin reductase family protein [Planctomycetota bacterium]|nr:flavin reductase family protein [Planctomycetota bacterium]